MSNAADHAGDKAAAATKKAGHAISNTADKAADATGKALKKAGDKLQD